MAVDTKFSPARLAQAYNGCHATGDGGNAAPAARELEPRPQESVRPVADEPAGEDEDEESHHDDAHDDDEL